MKNLINSYNEVSDISIAFWLGPIAIPWYGILLSFGFLFTVLFCFFEWRKKGGSSFDFSLLVGMGGVVALFGARFWYLIFNPSDYSGFISIFDITDGRSILGSLFFGFLWIYIFSKKFSHELEFRFMISIIIPNILLGQAIGRWGNFFEQDVYGKIVSEESLSFLPQFIINGMFIEGNYRQPLFLYESIVNFLGWVLILFFIKNIKYFKPGTHSSIYFIWYGLSRSIMELFRDEKFIMKINNFPTSFFLSILFFVFGIIQFIYYQYYFEKFNIWQKFYSNNFFWYKKNHLKLFFSFVFGNLDKENFIKEKKIIKNKYNLFNNNITKYVEIYRREMVNIY